MRAPISCNPRRARRLVGALALILGGVGMAAAQPPIDFESIPGGVPVDGLPISTQFLISHGIEFQLATGGSPVLAEVGGNPTTAFEPSDTPEADQGVYFLTDDGSLNEDSVDVIVLYDDPTRHANGVILDIDFTEVFTIEARNEADTVIATVVIAAGDPGTGNQKSTRWSISRPTADISSIRFSGERDGGVFGLAFDDFSVRPIFEDDFESGDTSAWSAILP